MLKALRTRRFGVDGPDHDAKNGVMDAGELQYFAEQLRVGIAKLRMTRTAFCRAAGISPNTLRALERGAQQPEAKTVAKIAAMFGMTPAALTHGKRNLDPGDPLLADLNDEDLEVAQAFHHSPMSVRQEILGALQRRGRRGSVMATSTAAELVDRLLRLPSDLRQLIATVIAEFESLSAHTPTSTAGTEDPGDPSVQLRKKGPPRQANG